MEPLCRSDPNCETVQLDVNGGTALLLVALCNIEPGTEIAYDYGWEADAEALPCRCGSPNCRGWIVDAAQIDKQKRLIGQKAS